VIQTDVARRLERLQGAVAAHRAYRDDSLNLIASENRPSPFVEGMVAEDLNRRYSYYLSTHPSQAQHYRGTRHAEAIEAQVQALGQELLNAKHVELRPLSGNIAGIVTTFALGLPGATALEVQTGHKYAEKMSSSPLAVDMQSIPIPWDGPRYNIDLDRTVELIEKHRPRIVLIGSAVFPFPHPVREIREAMDRFCPESYLVYDAAHVMGLIAGGRFQQPLEEGADLVITSTHKTLAGPQGGMILTNRPEIATAIAQSVSPLMIANHHLARLPALGATFLEWLSFGSAYADATIENARALGRALHERGVPCVGQDLGFSDSHTILPVVDAFGEAESVAARLEECGIVCGGMPVPPECGTHGLRVGVQEVTRWGMTAGDIPEVADCMVAGLRGDDTDEVRERARELAHRFSQVRFSLGSET